MDLQNKCVVDFFFTPLGDDMFKRTCNKRVKQPGKKGYSVTLVTEGKELE